MPTRIIPLTAAIVLVTSCGFEMAIRMAGSGYTSTYYKQGNEVTVWIKEEKLETMGGPHSEATRAFVEDEVKRKGYCKNGAFVPKPPERNPRGVYWSFNGSCKSN